MKLEVVVLAAGKGTRMRSALPKVLHLVAGKPMLSHILESAQKLSPDHIHVVCGHGADQVREYFSQDPNINWIFQAEQMGTGHAVCQALPDISTQSTVLVLYGDIPLILPETLKRLTGEARDGSLALLSASFDNPHGYGRVVRDSDNAICAIVEEADASFDQRKISEINTGFIAAPAEKLKDWLNAVDNNNSQGEYYLTDIVGAAARSGTPVKGLICEDISEVMGVNSRSDLAKAERNFQRREAEKLMDAGLTFDDPSRFDLRGQLEFGEDCRIDINVVVSGTVKMGKNVLVGPNSQISDSVIGDNVEIRANSIIEGAHIADHCSVGPFARLRPGTELATGARIGNFVETKNAVIGEDSKANHLAYVGDASVGQRVNIGAGVITCNYDGANKHQTKIENDAFIGSNTALVAPLTVGEGATVGAGSAVSRDVPAGQLAVTRAQQTVKDGWERPKKNKTSKGKISR